MKANHDKAFSPILDFMPGKTNRATSRDATKDVTNHTKKTATTKSSSSTIFPRGKSLELCAAATNKPPATRPDTNNQNSTASTANPIATADRNT